MMSLFLPMFAHVLLCAFLYFLLTLARAPAVWHMGGSSGVILSLESRKALISANLSNQFEWPLFFYVACLVSQYAGVADNMAFISLAWIFVAGRVLHSVVQIALNNVRLRGVVFTINFVAVIAMWVLCAIQLIGK